MLIDDFRLSIEKLRWEGLIFNQQSTIRNIPRLGFDCGFVDEHDRDVVFDRIDAPALGAFQAFRALAVFERLLARRTN